MVFWCDDIVRCEGATGYLWVLGLGGTRAEKSVSLAPSVVRESIQLSVSLKIDSNRRRWELTLSTMLGIVHRRRRASTLRVMCVVVHLTVAIDTGAGGLILEVLQQAIEDGRKYGTEQRTNPVDPVVAIERTQDNVGTEGSSWVERCTSEEHA
jgi:hypothetical protein